MAQTEQGEMGERWLETAECKDSLVNDGKKQRRGARGGWELGGAVVYEGTDP